MQVFRFLILLTLIAGLGACATTLDSNQVAPNEWLLTPEGSGPFQEVMTFLATYLRAP